MECTTVKPSRASLNLSEIVSNFAKVCTFRSIGVFPNQNHLSGDETSMCEASSNNADGSEFDGGSPLSISTKKNPYGDVDLLKLFDIVSALKLSYVQLQEAHVPYDPDKIVAADELVVAQLDLLCKIKRAYKEIKFTKARLEYSHLDCLRKETELNERILEKLKYQATVNDSQIDSLRRELEDLNSWNRKLVEKIRHDYLERKISGSILNVNAFGEAFKAASNAVHDFAKPLIALLKASGWDLDRAVNCVEDAVVYSKRSSKKYAFEAYIARRMFHGSSLDHCDINHVMRFANPIDALIETPTSGFAKFCSSKYLLVVHPLMEASFFGNLEQRNFVSIGKHPRTPFYLSFVKMAKCIWILQGMAASIDPKAEIFIVKRGSKFSDMYMESVEGRVPEEGQTPISIEFMIMPGFRIGDALVRSRVYLSNEAMA